MNCLSSATAGRNRSGNATVRASARVFALRAPHPYMRGAMPDTALMPIPGQIDPVPVARDITPRADGRVDLIGLPRKRIAELFEEGGLDARQAKLRAKQVFHCRYHR